jgi:hypothetical protein
MKQDSHKRPPHHQKKKRKQIYGKFNNIASADENKYKNNTAQISSSITS